MFVIIFLPLIYWLGSVGINLLMYGSIPNDKRFFLDDLKFYLGILLIPCIILWYIIIIVFDNVIKGVIYVTKCW